MQPAWNDVVLRGKTNDNMIKKAIFTAMILATTLSVFSQEKEFRTVFDNRDVRISGLGGPFMQFTAVAGGVRTHDGRRRSRPLE